MDGRRFAFCFFGFIGRCVSSTWPNVLALTWCRTWRRARWAPRRTGAWRCSSWHASYSSGGTQTQPTCTVPYAALGRHLKEGHLKDVAQDVAWDVPESAPQDVTQGLAFGALAARAPLATPPLPPPPLLRSWHVMPRWGRHWAAQWRLAHALGRRSRLPDSIFRGSPRKAADVAADCPVEALAWLMGLCEFLGDLSCGMPRLYVHIAVNYLPVIGRESR